MSSGLYALLGVLIGGVVTWFGQFLFARRTERNEWLVAERLVAHELERMIADLTLVVNHGVPPLTDSFLSTATWEQYRPIFAREIQNDKKGDAFWFGISRVMSATSHAIRPFLAGLPEGSNLSLAQRVALQDLINNASRAYESITGFDPVVSQLPEGDEPANETS